MALIFLDNLALNILDKTTSDDYLFITEEYKKRGINVVLLNNNEISKNFRESNKNHELFIEFLVNTYSKIKFIYFRFFK